MSAYATPMRCRLSAISLLMPLSRRAILITRAPDFYVTPLSLFAHQPLILAYYYAADYHCLVRAPDMPPRYAILFYFHQLREPRFDVDCRRGAAAHDARLIIFTYAAHYAILRFVADDAYVALLRYYCLREALLLPPAAAFAFL